jgi:MSHA pilin protein MshC
MPGRRWSPEGFTLVEVIAVLVLLSVLGAVVVSRVTMPDYDLRVETEKFKTHLRFCQFKALSDSDNQTITSWGINFPGGNSYTLTRNGSTAPISLPNESSPTRTLEGGVTFAGVPGAITFDGWGSPGAVDITISLTKSGQSQSVVINRNTGYIP